MFLVDHLVHCGLLVSGARHNVLVVCRDVAAQDGRGLLWLLKGKKNMLAILFRAWHLFAWTNLVQSDQLVWLVWKTILWTILFPSDLQITVDSGSWGFHAVGHVTGLSIYVCVRVCILMCVIDWRTWNMLAPYGVLQAFKRLSFPVLTNHLPLNTGHDTWAQGPGCPYQAGQGCTRLSKHQNASPRGLRFSS